MLSIIVGLIIAGGALFFAFQNNESVTIHFLGNELTGSVALIIIAAMIIGFVIGLVIFVPRSIADTWKAKTLQREVDRLRKKLGEEPITYESPGLGEEGEKNIEIVE